MIRGKAYLVTGLIVGAGAFGPAAIAEASPVVEWFGLTASADAPPVECSDSSQHLQQTTSSAVKYTSARDGTIASWSHFEGSTGDPGSGKLIVWRRTENPNAFLVVGKSESEEFTPGALEWFDVDVPIPVLEGDLIGLRTDADADCLSLTGDPADQLWHTDPGAPDPGVGSTFEFLPPIGGERVNVAAAVATTDGGNFVPPPPAPPEPPEQQEAQGVRLLDRALSIRYKGLPSRPRAAGRGARPRLGRLSGRLRSADSGCTRGTVTVFRRSKGADRTVGSDRANAKGKWSIRERNPKPGRYYASTGELPAQAGVCPAVESRSLRVV